MVYFTQEELLAVDIANVYSNQPNKQQRRLCI